MEKSTLYRTFLAGVAILFFGCTAEPDPDQVTIDPSRTYQTIDGFGSCIIGHREYHPEYSDPEFYDRVVNDLGLSIVRFPLNEHLEWLNDDPDPAHFQWDRFNLERMHRRPGLEQSAGTILQRFKEQGVERFMGTPWSPPQFMKTNRAPIQGGHLRADMIDELAEYLAASVMLAKKNYGIDINWVSINNESIFIEFYRSCIYHPQMMREAVRATERKFRELGIGTRILVNEDMMFPERIHYGLEPLMKDPETRDFQGHFAVHAKADREGLQRWTRLSEGWDKKLWMTETSGHEPNLKGALGMAGVMHDYLVYGNISAWLYWQISGGEAGTGSRYTLLGGGEPTDKYYVAKHYYRYIRPGAVRIHADTSTGPLKVSAFKHPAEGTLTMVVLNDTDEPVSRKFQILGRHVPDRFVQYRTSETEKCLDLGTLTGLDELHFPARSITTLVGEHDGLKTSEALPPEDAWKVPAGVEDERWGNRDPLPFQTEWQRESDSDANLIEEAEREGVNKTRANGWTILHDAILNGDGETVEYLIRNGADINRPAGDGWRPIHAAAATFVGNQHKQQKSKEFNKYEVFRLVLDAGPELNVQTSDGWTPLHAAVTNAHTGYRAEESEVLQKISDLIDAGVALETPDINGRTALHWAAWQGYNHFVDGKLQVEADVVETLIRRGADIHAADRLGNTPLHFAADMGYPEIVHALVKAGADPVRTNNAGRTPLELAEEKELIETVYILEKGEYPPELKAYVASKNKEASHGQLGRELLEAAWNGETEMVKELLEQGADLEYRDTDGLSALDRARTNGHEAIVKMLEEARNDP